MIIGRCQRSNHWILVEGGTISIDMPGVLRTRLERKARRLRRQLVPAGKSDGRSSLPAVAATADLAEDL